MMLASAKIAAPRSNSRALGAGSPPRRGRSLPRVATPPSTSPRRSSPRRAPGRRAQAGDRPLRRPQGLDGAAGRPGPEEARKILDPVLERMMEAVHRYEGTVNQVMGDGIMALFGAPSPTRTRCPRLLRGAPDAGERKAVRGRGAPRARRPWCKIRVGLNSGRGRCARRSAATSAWTTRPSARRRTWPRGWSRSPIPARSVMTP